ncbi:aminotransferase class I/II-fold pyridoxal phosphate-dependent enzyme [Aquincola sp. S2]|uniref:Aminotransferase n=1 Tax=Pseudaquabacterium terrae TaxID=2732868 RepID=A0ABX2E9I2_9BURK|nr:aminotransferase class I/II-fold pyridoxal phosphate-dependent enzyme [Aquabacterium terrae]NRF65393.1 aminotransferase class I/II-fold pyridoxal phosphate-dependent enzyme [Aquabacterium terrae]
MFDGYLRTVETSQTLLLNEQSRQLETSGTEVFKFGFGQSPFPPLPAAVEALRAHAAAKDYTPVQGLPELRERVAEFHRAAEGIDVGAEQVLIAPGSKLLLYAVMAAFQRADVLIPAPAWVSYAPQAKLLGHAAIRVATDVERRWRVTPAALEQTLAAKADGAVPSVLVLNHPGNPDGLSYSADELQALAIVLRRHRVLVISDEIYGLLNHAGAHVSLARHYPEATIVTGGLSKWCGAGGWRLGIALLPRSLGDSFKHTLLGIASETYSCAPLPVQRAAIAAYQWNAETQDYLAHQRRLLATLGTWCADELRASGLRIHAPEGGFYLFPDFTPHAAALHRAGITSAQQLCARLLGDTGVALLPGDAFGLPSQQLCARLAYVEFDGAAALQASREIGLQRRLSADEQALLFAKTQRGIHQLKRWLAAFQ